MVSVQRKVLIGGNWKCNGDVAFIKDFQSTLNSLSFDKNKAEVMIFPPSIHLASLKNNSDNSHLVIGSQNISKSGNGAFTGELSPQLLKDIGITTTLIGHSERRQFFGDDEQTIGEKLVNAEKNNIYVVFCIGENLQERESGKTIDVVKAQLDTLKNNVKIWENIAIAYEPVWAIGTGKTASPDQAEEVHAAIRKYLEENVSKEVASITRIIYGGSVNQGNCDTLIAKPNIDGFLVGGASLKPEFKTIVDSHKNKN